MKNLAQDYYFEIEHLLGSIKAANMEGKELDFYEGISNAAELIELQTTSGGKLIFIGNGASAAISSHMSTDFWKNGGIKAISFNDASGLTCISNDFGYEYVFEKPIRMFVDSGDILVAISSSGQSKNILLGIQAAQANDAKIITLSGFKQNNPLRRLGDINFYVPSNIYGHVEILHHSICHCVLDIIIQAKSQLTAGVVIQPTFEGMSVSVQGVTSRERGGHKIDAIKPKSKHNEKIREVGGS